MFESCSRRWFITRFYSTYDSQTKISTQINVQSFKTFWVKNSVLLLIFELNAYVKRASFCVLRKAENSQTERLSLIIWNVIKNASIEQNESTT